MLMNGRRRTRTKKRKMLPNSNSELCSIRVDDVTVVNTRERAAANTAASARAGYRNRDNSGNKARLSGTMTAAFVSADNLSGYCFGDEEEDEEDEDDQCGSNDAGDGGGVQYDGYETTTNNNNTNDGNGAFIELKANRVGAAATAVIKKECLDQQLVLDEQLESLIDFVIVYSKSKSSSRSHKYQFVTSIQRQKYLFNLSVNGLELIEVDKELDDLTFVLLRLPFEKCLEVAEKVKFKLPIEENNFEREKRKKLASTSGTANATSYTSATGTCGDEMSWWRRALDAAFQPVEIEKNRKRDFFTAPYSSDLRYKFAKFFDKANINKTIAAKDRINLLYEILSRTSYSKYLKESSIFCGNENDAKIGIERLIADGTFLAAYPLHESFGEINGRKTNRQLLKEYWARPVNWFTYQPIHIIRQYFGEKLAFYFSWLGFYTTWLILPSIVGLAVFLYGCFTVSHDIPTNDICENMANLTMCLPCPNQMNCDIESLRESCFYTKISYMVDNPLTVFYSVFMAVWTVLFIEFWKRKTSVLQFEWDTIDYEKRNETIRPQFETRVATRRKNPVTGHEEPYVMVRKRVLNYAITFSIVILMICLVIALVVGVIVYRVSLMMVFRNEDQAIFTLITSVSAACINLTLIIVLSRFYSWLAIKLTDMEYHKTDSKYERSLTIKMYLFQFVNFYSSIFYIAFFKGRKYFTSDDFLYAFQEECNQSGCLSELFIQLAIIMIGKQLLNNIQEVLWPLAQNYFNRNFANNRHKSSKKPWTNDFNLMDWTSMTLFDEYLEMVIQYGFITLFVVAFPLGPLFALMNNLFEIRIDAFKVLTQLKRPLPKKAQDIGIWLPILNIISKLGVITNGIIIAFTSEFIPRLVYKTYFSDDRTLKGYVNFTLAKNITHVGANGTRVECFYRGFRESYTSLTPSEYTKIYYFILAARLLFLICFEHVVFFIVMIMHFIPDTPKRVKDQIEREQLITQRALWEVKPEMKVPSARLQSTSFLIYKTTDDCNDLINTSSHQYAYNSSKNNSTTTTTNNNNRNHNSTDHGSTNHQLIPPNPGIKLVDTPDESTMNTTLSSRSMNHDACCNHGNKNKHVI